MQRWGLLPPYDPQAAWERYFKERAALDWWTAASRREGDDDNDEDWAARPPVPWTEGFRQPGTDAALERFPSDFILEEVGPENCGTVDSLNAALRGAVERVAAGCPRVEAASPGLAAALGRGTYFLAFEAEPSGDDDPRNVDYTTRLYSPCGPAKSVDFNYVYHCRSRANSVEFFAICHYALRGGADCQPDRPRAFKEEGKRTLFHLTCEDCGCAGAPVSPCAPRWASSACHGQRSTRCATRSPTDWGKLHAPLRLSTAGATRRRRWPAPPS